MSDIVVSGAKKINILDKIIQNVVIMVNINKMNRAIDEHLLVIKNTERDDQKVYQENILREIVYVKYQYDIMQRNMYELKVSYSDHIKENINSTDKTERLKLQKEFLEMEYDRVTRVKFRNKEDIKYMLFIISSVIQSVNQDIKDEGKSQKYNQIIRCAESIDNKIHEGTYTEESYTEMFEALKSYVNYINDNYDISKLPSDEKEIIELVIEATLNGLDSDIDRLHYEYNLIVDVCKNAYRYFKIVDKVFVKIQSVYDDSLVRGSINLQDYVNFYKDIYDQRIKTMVNDVHRTIKIEDEYLEYSRQLHEDDGINEFLLTHAMETTESAEARDVISAELERIATERALKEEQEKNENAEPPRPVEIIEEVYELVGQPTEMTETDNV